MTADPDTRAVVLAATRALVGIAARSLGEVGDDVSLVQFRVLVLVDTRGPQTMGALAESLGVSPSTATRVCDRLVAKRLVSRRSDGSDRRTVRVALTRRGQARIDEVVARRTLAIDEALAAMSAAGRDALARGLGEFAAVVGEQPGEASWAFGWPGWAAPREEGGAER